MSARRRKWRAPNEPTAPARQVWAALFPAEAWPKGWRVQWAGFMRNAAGLTIYSERRVLLSYADAKAKRAEEKQWGAVDTLLHEFVHMRAGKALRHGREFDRLEDSLRARLGMEPRLPRLPRHRHVYAREGHNENGWHYTCECGAVMFFRERRAADAR